MTRYALCLAALAIIALWLRGRYLVQHEAWGSLYERTPETGCYDPWLEHDCQECEQ